MYNYVISIMQVGCKLKHNVMHIAVLVAQRTQTMACASLANKEHGLCNGNCKWRSYRKQHCLYKHVNNCRTVIKKN